MPDREKAIKGLEMIKQFFGYGLPSTAEMFDSYYDTLNDAISLLKEQEGVVPYIADEAKCPVCKVKLTRQELIGDDVLFEDFFDYCPHCGKPVLWEGR